MVDAGASEIMNSRHLYSLAQDYNLLDSLIDYSVVDDSGDPRWESLGKLWESLGGVWGGRWTTLPDAGHFEWWPFT